MTSPIGVLKQFVFPSLRRIAPEKSDYLISEIKNDGITFRFVSDECRILFTADSKQKIINVGEKCLERLWAMSYAYFVFYESMCKAKHKGPSIETIDIGGDSELKKAGELLSWAISVDWQLRVEGKYLATPLPEWPVSLPKPIENPEKGTNEDIADKLFLSAVGFILHHELAHIRFRHMKTEGVESVLNEKDADREAAKWLLDGLEQTDMQLVQRVFGIAAALIWLASLDAYVPHSSDSHPPGYDRLYQILSSLVDEKWHPVWGFVSIALRLHLDASSAAFNTEMTHETPQDAVNYYCDVLSQRFRGDGN